MKIEIEISDSDKDWFDREGINIEKLVRGAADACINGFKEVLMAKKAGLPMDMSSVTEYGAKLGKAVMKDARGEATDGQV